MATRATSANDALKLLQGLGAQAAATARSLAEELADAGGRANEPLVRAAAQLAQLSTMWVAPVQTMLREQREFFEVMSTWAAQQREFADRLAKLAEANQKVSEQLSAVLGPVLEQAEAAQKRAARATSRSRT